MPQVTIHHLFLIFHPKTDGASITPIIFVEISIL